MTLRETIIAMAREAAFVASFLAAIAGTVTICAVLDIEPWWPISAVIIGTTMLVGIK